MTRQTHLQKRLASYQIIWFICTQTFRLKKFKMTINITVTITGIGTFILVITTFKYFPKINSLSQIQSKSQKLIKSNSLSHLRHRHSKNPICSHNYSVSQGKSHKHSKIKSHRHIQRYSNCCKHRHIHNQNCSQSHIYIYRHRNSNI